MLEVARSIFGCRLEIWWQASFIHDYEWVGGVYQCSLNGEACAAPFFHGDDIAAVSGGEELSGHATCRIDKCYFDFAAGALDAGDGVVAIFLEVAVVIQLEGLDDDA